MARSKKRGKKYLDAVGSVDPLRSYSGDVAVGLVKSMSYCRFDESVEVAVRLGVDPRRADQMIRGTVRLPSGTGKEVRVAVFAQGEAAVDARAAGADKVGAEDLAEEVSAGTIDFDVFVATPDMMRVVGPLGRILGPRGLMPNPKSGTVTFDVATAVADFKSGKVEYRTDRFANVHVPIGKVSFSDEDLLKNLRAVLAELHRAKPAGAKGKYVKTVVLSASMGPGVRIDPAAVGAAG